MTWMRPHRVMVTVRHVWQDIIQTQDLTPVKPVYLDLLTMIWYRPRPVLCVQPDDHRVSRVRRAPSVLQARSTVTPIRLHHACLVQLESSVQQEPSIVRGAQVGVLTST